MIRSRSVRRFRNWSVVMLALLLVSALAAGAHGQAGQPPRQQPPTPTFRTQVNVVQVDAVVLDPQGRFVSDLQPEEFEVLEDGKPQRVVSVDLVNIPMGRVETPLFATAPIKPDVQTNARPFDGRVFLIVLDDLHTAGTRTLAARRIARLFIEQNIAPNDLAAVVFASGNRRNSQEFTSDRALLLRAVDRFVGQKVISPSLAMLSMGRTAEEANMDAPQRLRIFNARSALETLTDLATFSGHIRNRRKAIVLIGEGMDYGFESVVATPLELRDRLREFAAAANRANLTLYAFDPSVYTQLGDDMVEIASTLPGTVTTSGVEIINSVSVQNDAAAARDNLRTLATETGGFAVVTSRNFADAFERIRAENSNYYMIGYSPTNDARDGKFRRIEVRVKRSGLRVEARKGYLAPKGSGPVEPVINTKEGTSPAVREALTSTLPVTGFTLRVAAAPFKGVGPNASVIVLVQADGRDLQFTRNGEKFSDSVEVSVIAVDRAGKTRGGERQNLDMPLSPATRALVEKAGLVFQVRVSVPPGEYQLRVAARDEGSGRVGSVHYELEVPDFSGAPLSMSGLVLTADEAGEVPSPKPDETLRKLLPATPITTREFRQTDAIIALAEVYDNQGSQPHKVWIKTTVQAEDGRAMFQHDEERSSAELGGGRGGYGYTSRVPLGELGPGLYVLRVEARSGLGVSTTASRELQFTVR